MSLESSYLKEIKESILKSNALGITEIKNIEFVKGLNFNKDEYPFIAALIRQKKAEEINRLPDSEKKAFEDLTIIRFYDQSDKEYIVTVYETDELWQDPEILEIFPQ